MTEGLTRALATRASLGITGVATEEQLDAAIASVGLSVWRDAPLAGRVYGLFYDGVVCVKAGLLPGTRVVALAHETAHALCGHAGGLYHPPTLAGSPAESAAEEEAQIGAYALLVGRPATTPACLSAQVQHAHDQGGLPWDFLCAVESILAAR